MLFYKIFRPLNIWYMKLHIVVYTVHLYEVTFLKIVPKVGTV